MVQALEILRRFGAMSASSLGCELWGDRKPQSYAAMSPAAPKDARNRPAPVELLLTVYAVVYTVTS